MNIEECHKLLNNVYIDCENLYDEIKNLFSNVKMDSYNSHYIKINSKYEYQKYFMPVISIGEIGDICFNLDGISFEFFMDKDNLVNNCNFDELLNYNVEMYNAYDSTIDIYEDGLSKDEIISKIIDCKYDKIGITVNLQKENIENIPTIFSNICEILKI